MSFQCLLVFLWSWLPRENSFGLSVFCALVNMWKSNVSCQRHDSSPCFQLMPPYQSIEFPRQFLLQWQVWVTLGLCFAVTNQGKVLGVMVHLCCYALWVGGIIVYSWDGSNFTQAYGLTRSPSHRLNRHRQGSFRSYVPQVALHCSYVSLVTCEKGVP